MSEISSNKIDDLFNWILSARDEMEWIEFKINNHNPQKIGEYISSLSNSAAYNGKPFGYLIWGIKDGSFERIGTNFEPDREKVGNESLENWLIRQSTPRLQIKFHHHNEEGKRFVLLEVPSARSIPTSFSDTEFIRIKSYNQKLKDYPDWERKL